MKINRGLSRSRLCDLSMGVDFLFFILYFEPILFWLQHCKQSVFFLLPVCCYCLCISIENFLLLLLLLTSPPPSSAVSHMDFSFTSPQQMFCKSFEQCIQLHSRYRKDGNSTSGSTTSGGFNKREARISES